MDECMKQCRTLLRQARASGLRNIPDPIAGASLALQRPVSGRISDTKFHRTPGSDRIVAEAKKASPAKPLLVFCGGPCTTVACAYLTDPSITKRMVVFQIDGGGYNGKDSWSWKIVQKQFVFANWARGYFWPKVGKWDPKRFDSLPRNALCDALRKYAQTTLARANQWGDGPWVMWLFDRRCLTSAKLWDKTAITVPREATDLKAMADEFFKTMADPAVYRSVKQDKKAAAAPARSSNDAAATSKRRGDALWRRSLLLACSSGVL